MDKNGYLVNRAGEFLNGWPVTNGVVNQNTLDANPGLTDCLQSDSNRQCHTIGQSAGNTAPARRQLRPISSDIDVYDRSARCIL